MKPNSKFLERAALLRRNFAIYGYGNFDLTLEETALILQMLEVDDAEKLLEGLYAELEAIRLG